ncbi:MAG: dihydroorotate dehydrogenase electron transfer subunit [Thermoleophilaceae bacterium]|nr:dihydroorotate dehydrogenase electron transfer subunit [Thermoleophilaceae bacterium]
MAEESNPNGEPRTLAPLGRRAARVTANRSVGAYRLIEALDLGGPIDPRPGQFYMLATAAGWGAGEDERPYLPRAFSFARVRAESGRPELGFLVEAIGPGTARLAALEVGEDLLLTGPLGVGFSAPAGGGALLVGGGIGVAPILAWHDALGDAAPVLLGFRSSPHAGAAALFAGAPLVATDDGSTGRRALVTELLRERLDDSRPGALPIVYACGPPPMLEAVRAICSERDVRAELALEAGMACGYGACFGCVVPTRAGYLRLCVDGPVLDAAALETAVAPGAGH